LRLTARVTRMMAWLLDQRAVHAGEIDAAEAVRRAEPLAGVDICTAEDDALHLGPALAALMMRSQRLYVRVARLDDMARRNSA
jgi:regulator of CtrA degradation